MAAPFKVSVLHRDPDEYVKTHKSMQRYYRNPDPALHPFERARELQRALTAVKMDKIFAKPLVAVMDGHTDSVNCMAKGHTRMHDFYTGSCDGEIRVWNLTNRACVRSIQGHDGFIRGICSSYDDKYLFSCGDDKVIKQWSLPENVDISEHDSVDAADTGNLVELSGNDVSPLSREVKPLNVFRARSILTSIDHHWKDPLIVTSGETVDVWDHHRSSPLHCFEWGCNAIYSVRFNPAEPCLIASTGGDRSLGLYDVRANSPIRKVILRQRSNAVAWNPMQPFYFTAANEDSNLYTFDMRKLDTALRIHKDFTNSVLDVDYSPTGTEFVASSHDTTVRIFRESESRSREVYSTKRMQMVLCCAFSSDSHYVLTGSADMCIRVWKSEASKPLGPLPMRQRKALAYRKALIRKYQYVGEVKRIYKRKHVPAFVKSKTKLRKIMYAAKQRRVKKQREAEVSAARKEVIFKQLE